jgi:flavorubredoxin
MKYMEMTKDVYYIGAKDWDRRLFDELIPLPEGTTYNCYLVKGSDKTAVIDSVDPVKFEILTENLKRLNIKKVDYLISNHAEQDHSGSISLLADYFPQAKVVTNPKCRDFLKDLLHIPDERFLVVNEGESLSLGNKTFEFYLTPWVHWPETMTTWLKEDKIAFTGDFFGSHRTQSRMFVEDEYDTILSAKRYYAEIMMPFRIQIKKNIEKVESLKPQMIAPSHGPVWNKPSLILEAYKDWISDKVCREVVIPFVSMHDSTRRIVDHLVERLTEKGVIVKPFNLTKTDTGELAMAMVEAATVIFASPMVLAGPHPVVVSAAYLVNAIRPKTRFIAITGSFGWGGKLAETLSDLTAQIKAERLEPVLVKGLPRDADYQRLDQLVEEIIRKMDEAGIR